jgi:hypothetical protein
MAAIDYVRFDRLVTRCAEIATEAGMKPSVVRVHDEILKSAAEAFRDAHQEVTASETSFSKENGEALNALAELDGPYRETRSVVLAFAPETKLPDTLKAQPTDTDKLNAIESLLDVLDEHAGQAWADEQAQSDFGKKAAGAVKELNEAITANKALSEARELRAKSYGPAYERYLRFKRVVRDALGPKSKQYKRIHLRGAGAAEEAGTGAPGGGAAPGGGGEPVK